MDNTIGNKLKSLRENKKLTLDEVAKKNWYVAANAIQI